MKTETVIMDRVPRGHNCTWHDPDYYRSIYESVYLEAHRAALEAGGIVIRTVTRPPLHACTICGTRTCAAARTGVAGCIDPDDRRAEARRIKRAVPTWQGDAPTTCQVPGCRVPLAYHFYDGILPGVNGHTHGLFCELCAMTRGITGRAVLYRRSTRRGPYRKVTT